MDGKYQKKRDGILHSYNKIRHPVFRKWPNSLIYPPGTRKSCSKKSENKKAEMLEVCFNIIVHQNTQITSWVKLREVYLFPS